MTAKTTVVNLRREPFDVYIGRGSLFGNPFRICGRQDRERVIRRYKEEFLPERMKDPEFAEALKELKGQRLGCYCKPLACHGDPLAELVDSL